MAKEIPDKIQIQVLYNAGFKKAKTIHHRTKIPLRTCFRHIEKLNNEENLDRRPYRRSKKKVTERVTQQVIRKVKISKKPVSLRDVAKSVDLHHETVRTILHENGLKYLKRKRKLYLTQSSKEKRLKFAEDMVDKESDWPYVIFTDEASFWLHKTVPNAQWGEEGMEIEAVPPHSKKLHVWGAICAKGALPLEIFEENMNAAFYTEILKKKTRAIKNLYPEGYFYQQDNAPAHKAAISMNYIKENFNNFLHWPPYSADLSPIENIWAWLKREVGNERPQSITALKSSIKKHWKRITPEFLKNYIDSMPNRIAQVIENRGGQINY